MKIAISMAIAVTNQMLQTPKTAYDPNNKGQKQHYLQITRLYRAYHRSPTQLFGFLIAL